MSYLPAAETDPITADNCAIVLVVRLSMAYNCLAKRQESMGSEKTILIGLGASQKIKEFKHRRIEMSML